MWVMRRGQRWLSRSFHVWPVKYIGQNTYIYLFLHMFSHYFGFLTCMESWLTTIDFLRGCMWIVAHRPNSIFFFQLFSYKMSFRIHFYFILHLTLKASIKTIFFKIINYLITNIYKNFIFSKNRYYILIIKKLIICCL